MAAAVRVHHDEPTVKQVFCYCGASVVGGQNSDPLELPTTYTGTNGGPSTNIQNAQTYSRISSLRSGSGLDGTISWRDMIPGTVHSAEVTWAYEMRHTYGVANTAFMIYGVGGTGLDEDWIGGATLTNCLTRFQSELLTIGTEYVMRSVTLQIAAVDADSAPAAAAYGANLATFIGAFRAIDGWEDMSFIISLPSIHLIGEGFALAAELQEATLAYMETDANCAVVNTDDLEFTGTGAHYLTDPSLITLGERYAYSNAQMLYLPRQGRQVYFA
jgi:hypothetical protein